MTFRIQTQATPLTAMETPPAKPGTAKRNSLASTHLDAVRGGAALLVLLSHVRAIFFADTPDILVKGANPKLFYFITGAGYSSVMVFFVLSGYFISSSVFRSIEKNNWNWGNYALNRLTRLYVVLIPALLLSVFWDCLGMKLFGTLGVYGGYRTQLPQPILERETLATWLGNLFFLQEIRVPPFGGNAALWSLSYEFWYYLLFPLGVLGFLRSTPLRMRLIYLALTVGILVFVGKPIAMYFLIWLMGAVVSRLRSSSWAGHPVFISAGLVATFSTYLLSKIVSGVPCWSYLLAIAFACTMYGLLNVRDHPGYGLYRRVSHFLSGISYSLYLCHLPLVLFLYALIIGDGRRWQPDVRHICLALLLCVVIVGYAYAVWWVAESRTDYLRERLLSALRRLPQGRTKKVKLTPS